MELKEGAFYVTPSGIVVDKDQYEKTRKEVGEQLTRVFKVVTPIVQKALNSMYEVMKNIMSDIDDIENEVKSQINEVKSQIEFEKGFKRPWFMKMDTTKKHQVMNRKPMFSHIRNQI